MLVALSSCGVRTCDMDGPFVAASRKILERFMSLRRKDL